MGMSFRFIYPFLFFALFVLPFGIYLIIDSEGNQSTFVAISGVASFLFGLMATFTLTGRHSRLDKIVHNASIERGEITFICESLNIFPEEKSDVLNLIDEYFMSELDLDTKYFHKTDKQFLALYDRIIKLKINNEKQKKMYDRLIMAMEKIEDTRKYTATLFEDRIAKQEWAILYFLISVIYTSLLFANTGGVVVISIILLLAAIISYLLIVTIKLDRMKWKVDEKIFEPYAQTMETIGLTRYYPKLVFDENSIKGVYRLPKGTEFRVGDLPNYPNMDKRIVQIHKV
jgi:hypothetical protein